MKVIYGVCSWGLGHATRSLPIIRRLIRENHELTIISHDRSLTLLQHELNNNASFINIPDYPIFLSETPAMFLAKSTIYGPLLIRNLKQGHSKCTHGAET